MQYYFINVNLVSKPFDYLNFTDDLNEFSDNYERFCDNCELLLPYTESYPSSYT